MKFFMLSKYFRCLSRGKRKHCQITSCLISPRKGFFIHGQADDLQIHDDWAGHWMPQLTNQLIHYIKIVGRWMWSNSLKLSSSGWVRLVVCIFDQIIYGGDTANTSQTVHNLDAYILILPAVSPKTLPGGRGRVSSTIVSSGWSVGLRLLYISSSSYTLVKSLF